MPEHWIFFWTGGYLGVGLSVFVVLLFNNWKKHPRTDKINLASGCAIVGILWLPLGISLSGYYLIKTVISLVWWRDYKKAGLP